MYFATSGLMRAYFSGIILLLLSKHAFADAESSAISDAQLCTLQTDITCIAHSQGVIALSVQQPPLTT